MARRRKNHTLIYDENHLTPEDLLNFVELDWFFNSWEGMKLSDRDLSALQIIIMCNPKAGDVIQGTRGVRKLRFSPESWNTGKSHALRVCYVYFEKYGQVLLCFVYKKGQLDNLSDQAKAAVNQALKRIEVSFKKRFGF